MTEAAHKTALTLEQKQRDLQARCRHPTGSWQPVDWREPRQSIPDRITAVASSHPNRLAVRDPQTSLTYAELDAAANQVANAILADRGPGQEVIALFMGLDALAVTAALGVLKAGKIYVAPEPSFPQKRSAHILEDAGVELILSDGQHLAQARELAAPARQAVQVETLVAGDAQPPGVPVPLDSLAILNYTSGSTGLPKGVVQSHFSAFVHAVRRYSFYRVGDGDRIASWRSLAWAGTFGQIFGPLCLGASIAPFDLGRHGFHRLLKWLQDAEPTGLTGRILARQLVSSNLQRQFPSVRLVTLGGDTIYRQDVLACLRIFPNALVAVALGISEAGIVTNLLLDSAEMVEWEIVPLGYPAPGLRIKLLSEEGREVAPGDVGEIVILDRALAAGYWRRPELTASRFRTVASLGPGPAYFSGDLGRQTPDGLLHHMGRKDFMVKVRGYQVFTNEIEGMLHGVEGVQEVCVMAHTLPQGDQRLAAYLVADHEAFPGIDALYARFADVPRHMAPQSYLFLETLPKTPTGKVDRGRLVLPPRSRLHVTAEHAAPRDLVERYLARTWGQVLGIEGLGIHDNFLELGGDSLDSTRIISQVLATLGVDISLQDFFDTLTVAEMAAKIRAAL
jgi:acyl-CoA synthetase (AMP-forming)/AMP-acid ligase II/acyl carrier protein